MQRIKPFFRYAFGLALIVLGGVWVFGSSGDRSHRTPSAHAAELKVPDDAAVERFDFEQPGLAGWKTVDGQWSVEEMPGAPSGQRLLDHPDSRFRAGQAGLWTKADSITAFDDFVVRGVIGGG